jgi:hypothetical protein
MRHGFSTTRTSAGGKEIPSTPSLKSMELSTEDEPIEAISEFWGEEIFSAIQTVFGEWMERPSWVIDSNAR